MRSSDTVPGAPLGPLPSRFTFLHARESFCTGEMVVMRCLSSAPNTETRDGSGSKKQARFYACIEIDFKATLPPLPQNQAAKHTAGVTWSLFAAGEERGRCFTIEYVMPMNIQLTSESTVNVLSKWFGGVLPFASCKAPKGRWGSPQEIHFEPLLEKLLVPW